METITLTQKINLALQKYFPQFLIAGLILLVYIQNLWFDFVYLDDNLILSIQYERVSDLSEIFNAFKGGYLLETYYRPMVIISFIIDNFICDQSVMIYHLTNIVFHIIIAIMLYYILLKLKFSQIQSLVIAVFFAIHPINVNAVSWIVGRNDLLFALFSLMSFITYLNYQIRKSKIYLIASLLTYLFSILSKESGIIIPLLFIMYEILLGENKNIGFRKYYIFIIYLIPLAIYITLRLFVANILVKDGINIYSFIENIYIIFEYITKLFYLTAIEPLPTKNYLYIILGLIFSLILLILRIKFDLMERNKRLFDFGIIFFLLTIFPTLFVRIVSSDGEFNYIDCRTYLPIIGLFISIGSLFQFVKTNNINKYFLPLVVVLVGIYLISYTLVKNQTYKNGEIFWKTVTNLHPNRADYWIGLGTYYYNKENFVKAAELGEKAININPQVKEYYYKASNAYFKAGNISSSIEKLEKVLPIDSEKEKVLFNLLKLYELKGDTIKADITIKKLKELARLNNNSDFIALTSYFYLNKGEIKLAIDLMKIAVNIEPLNSIYLNDLGTMYYKIADIKSAKDYFLEALKLDPENKKYLYNLSLCQ